MPTYDYACPACGPFEALRTVARRDEPGACPDCGTVAPRVLGGAPQLALMAAATRLAVATNERACHEPRRSRDVAAPHRHHAGCGCGGASRSGATARAPNGARSFPAKRPWMISH